MFKIRLILILCVLMACNKNDPLKVSITPLKLGAVMDPARVYFLNEYYLIENLSLRLVEMDSKTGYEFMLASEITPIADKIYSIKIKETYFSNGDRVMLEDVRASFLRALGNKNSHVKFSELVESISIEGDKLILNLFKRTNDFLYYLTLIDLSVLHKSQLKDQLKVEDWANATSGAFSYHVDSDGKAELVKNKYFKLTKNNYPERIQLHTAMGRDSYDDYRAGLVELGEFNLKSYDKSINDLDGDPNLQVIGNRGDMINFLALNVDSVKFKSDYNRKWILKKIMLGLTVDKRYNQVAEKALQFLTPKVKGFLEEEKILKEVSSWELDLNTIPEELKNGITISTYKSAFEVTLESIVKQLESVIGIPVKIENNVASADFERTITERKFEVFLGITSMDQVIVGESINLYYFSSFPMFKDVNKKIHSLMNDYKHSDPSQVVSVVKNISLQMIKDAECVPLFYVASPFFYNKSKLDISGLDELTYFNLWKIKEL